MFNRHPYAEFLTGPLSHKPGHAQVDFGEADGIIDLGRCGLWHFLSRCRVGVGNHFLQQVSALCHARQPFRHNPVHKKG